VIPLRDTEPVRRATFVTWLLIAANVLAFAYEWRLDDVSLRRLFAAYALHPADYSAITPSELLESPRALALPFLSNMFLHGGIAHVLGNAWMLWIFGDNVEDRLGPVCFLVFYVLAGVLASVVHVVTNSASTVPTIGASGAIAGVMGAYFVLFPRAHVVVFVPILLLPALFKIPAVVFLALWFLLQLGQGTLMSGLEGPSTGGIAWWAHVGGFLAGIVLLAVLGGRRAPRRERRD
jgi:membrane associated rhomboid family serine protease